MPRRDCLGFFHVSKTMMKYEKSSQILVYHHHFRHGMGEEAHFQEVQKKPSI
jgi:hypothetical protein